MPFEEDEKDPSIWFLDHNYHDSMFSMFKRINGTVLLAQNYQLLLSQNFIGLITNLLITCIAMFSKRACGWLVQYWAEATGK